MATHPLRRRAKSRNRGASYLPLDLPPNRDYRLIDAIAITIYHGLLFHPTAPFPDRAGKVSSGHEDQFRPRQRNARCAKG
jgi:hypothetical protein